MVTASQSTETPGFITILAGVFDAIRAAPLLIGLFVVAGITNYVLPFPIDTIVRIVVISVGAFIAYRALGGAIRTDEPFHRRLLMASVATLITYLLLVAGIYSVALSGLLQYVFLLLLIPGVYVYSRLFLATTAVMADGYGPFEALSESWELTDGNGATIAGAVVLVFVIAAVGVYTLVIQFQSVIVFDIGGIMLADMSFTGMQAALYWRLTGPS